MSRLPAPKMLPCGHFSQDPGDPDHCRICADKAAAEAIRIRAELVGEAEGEPEYDGDVLQAESSPSAEPESDSRTKANEPEDGDNKALLIGGLSLGAALIGLAAYLVGRRGRP